VPAAEIAKTSFGSSVPNEKEILEHLTGFYRKAFEQLLISFYEEGFSDPQVKEAIQQ
jgi:hypothetical protein